MRTVFEPIRRESTVEKVHEAFREAILAGDLKPGDRLIEVPLASQFHVSRSVVREALQRLVHEGLIVHNANRGAQVVYLTPAQVDDIISLRLLLEPEAVRLAQGLMREEEKLALRRMAAGVENSRGDSRHFTQLDFRFHQAIWGWSGNDALRKHLDILTAPLFAIAAIVRQRRRRSDSEDRRARPHGDHIQLADTICGSARDEALEAMRLHITENWQPMRSVVEEFDRLRGE